MGTTISSYDHHRVRRLQSAGVWLTLLVVVGHAPSAAGAVSSSSLTAIVAQADETVPQTAPPPPAESPETKPITPEQKRKVRSTAVLLFAVLSIAVTGLLLIIVAISVRGFQRKLAGPVRIEREPQDLLPDVASPAEQQPSPAGSPDDDGAAADETQYT